MTAVLIFLIVGMTILLLTGMYFRHQRKLMQMNHDQKIAEINARNTEIMFAQQHEDASIDLRRDIERYQYQAQQAQFGMKALDKFLSLPESRIKLMTSDVQELLQATIRQLDDRPSGNRRSLEMLADRYETRSA